MRPGLAGVGRLVHAVARREIGTDDSRAAADIDNVGIGRRYRDGADRAGGLLVEQRHPGRAEVGRSPDAAVIEADVEYVGLAGHARERPRPPCPGRPDGAPVHLGVKSPVNRLSLYSLYQRRHHQTTKK